MVCASFFLSLHFKAIFPNHLNPHGVNPLFAPYSSNTVITPCNILESSGFSIKSKERKQKKESRWYPSTGGLATHIKLLALKDDFQSAIWSFYKIKRLKNLYFLQNTIIDHNHIIIIQTTR